MIKVVSITNKNVCWEINNNEPAVGYPYWIQVHSRVSRVVASRDPRPCDQKQATDGRVHVQCVIVGYR